LTLRNIRKATKVITDLITTRKFLRKPYFADATRHTGEPGLDQDLFDLQPCILFYLIERSNFTIYFDSLSQFLIASVPDTFNLLRSITALLTGLLPFNPSVILYPNKTIHASSPFTPLLTPTTTTKTIMLIDTSRIIAIHHEDIPDADSFLSDSSSKPQASNSLAHIATTLITLKSSEALRQDQEDFKKGTVTAKEFAYLTVHGNAWDSAVCEIEHKRKSGKVAKEVWL
jgi:hypothetical protein